MHTAAELGLSAIVLPTGQEIWIRKASFAAQASRVEDLTAVARASVANPLQSAPSLGPGTPLPAAHPEEAEPRRWQYQPGLNLRITPRSTEAISFETLKAIADNYDVAQLCMQKRENDMRGLAWHVAPRTVAGEERAAAKSRAEGLRGAVDAATTFLQRPNQEDFWAVWLVQWLHDLFRYDAPVIYRRRTRGGELFAAEVVDGSTFRPIIDLWGRVPQPPEPAYGQVVFGVTWGVYTTEELLYTPYWQSSDSPYGRPPAERILMTINRALRRQSIDLSMFTEGTLPVAFYRVPESWTSAQLGELQEIFDGLLAGNDVARSRVRFVPGGQGTGLDQVHPEPKTEVEEWLMYVTCAAYEVMPTEIGFQPRGSGLGGKGFAEQQADSTNSRATRPLANHVKGVVDVILADWLGEPGLEFTFEGLDKPEDIVKQAQADKIYVSIGKMSIDELRERDDQDPIGLGPYVSGGQVTLVEDILNPPDPVVRVDPATGQPLQMPFGMTGAGVGPKPDAKPDDDGDPDEDGKGDGTPMGKLAAADLGAWQRKALKAVRAGRPAAVPFASEAIGAEVGSFLAETLAKASSPADVRAAFDLAKAGASAGPFGPAPRVEPRFAASSPPASPNRAATWSASSAYRRWPSPSPTSPTTPGSSAT